MTHAGGTLAGRTPPKRTPPKRTYVHEDLVSEDFISKTWPSRGLTMRTWLDLATEKLNKENILHDNLVLEDVTIYVRRTLHRFTSYVGPLVL
jgi:hypothetical protein